MEEMPPVTVEELKTYLSNRTFSVYLYVGNKNDKGWGHAELAFDLMARLRVYLVRDSSLISEWTGNKRPRGLVFGWGPELKAMLNKSESEDFARVITAIRDARKSTR